MSVKLRPAGQGLGIAEETGLPPWNDTTYGLVIPPDPPVGIATTTSSARSSSIRPTKSVPGYPPLVPPRTIVIRSPVTPSYTTTSCDVQNWLSSLYGCPTSRMESSTPSPVTSA